MITITKLVLVSALIIVLRTQVSGQDGAGTQHDTLKAASLLRLSDHHLYVRDDSSFYYAQQALSLSQRTKYTFGIIRACRRIAVIELGRGNFSIALSSGLKALRLAEESENTREIVICNGLLGVIERDQRNYGTAIHYFLKGYSINEKLGDSKVRAIQSMAIGNLYNNLNKPDSAMIYLKEAYKLMRNDQDDVNFGGVLGALGRTYELLGSPDLALKYYRLGLKHNIKTRNSTGASYAGYEMASFFYGKKLTDSAMHYAKQGFSSAVKAGFKKNISKSSSLLAKLYEQKGNIDSAYKYQKIYSAIQDSLFPSEAEANRLRVKDLTAVKDREISSQQENIQSSRRWIFYLLGASVLVLAVTVAIYFSQRKTKRLNQMITRQHDELEHVSMVKNRLLAIVGHDIRGPLNMLLGLSHVLRQDNVPAEKMAAYMDQLESTLTHTSFMMDNLLYWAASQMDGYRPDIRQVSMNEIASNVMLLYEARAADKGITLNNAVSPGLLVNCDEDMMTLVMRNLVNNSIKFSHPGSSITVRSSEEDSGCAISVMDTGIGMSPVLIDQVNSVMFSGLESSRGTQKETGIGLGLLLCKTFTQLMNGQISAALNPGGSGTIFKIVLPNG